MSVSKWRYTEECNGRPCPGDCDHCSFEPTDLISRADAIEAVAQQWLFEASAESPYVNDDDIGEYRKLAEKLFEDVPSADAVQGEWQIIGYDKDYVPIQYTCSVCGSKFLDEYDFCPDCGARMKGGAK